MKAENDEAVLLGKQVSDLQTGVEVGSNSLSGRLFYNEGWPNGPLEGPGYYLALAFESEDWTQYDSVKVGLDPSVETGLVEIIDDPDKNGVFKVSSSTTQKFVVEATKGEDTVRKEYSLRDLLRGFVSTPNMANQTCLVGNSSAVSVAVTQSGVQLTDNVEGFATNYTGVISGSADEHVVENDPDNTKKYYIGFEVDDGFITDGSVTHVYISALDASNNSLFGGAFSVNQLQTNRKVALQVGETSDLQSITPEDVKAIVVSGEYVTTTSEGPRVKCTYTANIVTPTTVVVPDSLVTTPNMVAQTCAYPAQQTVTVTQSSIALQDNVNGYGEEFTGTISGQVHGYVDPNEETQYRIGFKLNEELIKSTSQIEFKLYDANNNEINLGSMMFSGSEIPANGYIAISVGSTNIGPADPEDIKSIVAEYVDFTDSEDVKFITVTYTTNLTKGS